MKYAVRVYAVNEDKRENQTAEKNPPQSPLKKFITAFKSFFFPSQVTPFDREMIQKKGKGFYFQGKEYIHHSDLTADQSAVVQFTPIQIILFSVLTTAYLICLLINWVETLVFTIAFFTLIYFIDLLFNFFLVSRSFSQRHEIVIEAEEIQKVPNTDWPLYTVFCPLYKEYKVINQFVKAMSRLNYPKKKLQIMFLLEENDKETIHHLKNYELPDYFETVIVPDSLPKTKPKALNYGLLKARGEYVVIYDAEDIPDRDQLKKVILGFQKSDSNIGCIQAKLNFYNPNQNLLTKLFTAEYSLWFDLVLTGLQAIEAPIPLGGTSNHFRKQDLLKLKGWDSFNVTEDCDLGMRLSKKGFRTAIIDSTTLEEANSDLPNWFWQRSRWIKGYIQTYMQHLRDLNKFSNSLRRPNVLIFHLMVGGKIMSIFINPLLWIITSCYFIFYDYLQLFIEQFFPFTVLYLAAISLLIGNFLYLTYYMLACYSYGHYRLIKYMYFVPFYWLAMSFAGWIAVYQFIFNPHYWAKTKHGLHLNNSVAKKPVVKKRLSFAWLKK